MGEGDIKSSGGRVRVWSNWLHLLYCIRPEWWPGMVNIAIQLEWCLWTIWSAVVIQGICLTTCPGFCASQKHFVGLPEQKVRSDELFLKCLMGSWKIQKYVSVVLTSSRGAMAVIHPQTLIPLVEEMLGSNKTWFTVMRRHLSLTSLVKKYTCAHTTKHVGAYLLSPF